MMINKPFKYTEEQHNFIHNNYKGISTDELTMLFNNEFKTNRKPGHLKSYKSNYKLAGGYDCRFKKGEPNPNKGKTRDEYMSKEAQQKAKISQFKKGNIPHKHVAVGSEIIRSDGYIYIKTEEPNRWELKQRAIWEKYNGKLEDTDVLIFLDQDRSNCDIENLCKVQKKDLARLNQNGLLSDEPELNQAGISLVKLMSKIGEVDKKDE